MGELKLTRCPVCGRIPKIRYYDICYAGVQCRPWYRFKAHMRADIVCAQPSELRDAAINAWNAKANCANLPVW